MNFNPRTPVGCDNPTGLHQPLRSDFNPRTPVGCDAQWSFGRRLQMLFQSTHPSGVRRPSTRRASPTRHFNPRTPVGCDWPRYAHRPASTNFNPRTPVGCDDTWRLIATIRCKFQSTHPSGVRRHSQCAAIVDDTISIHAPQWGATLQFQPSRIAAQISIHAPQWGATGLDNA